MVATFLFLMTLAYKGLAIHTVIRLSLFLMKQAYNLQTFPIVNIHGPTALKVETATEDQEPSTVLAILIGIACLLVLLGIFLFVLCKVNRPNPKLKRKAQTLSLWCEQEGDGVPLSEI